jgi:hypothetical protein
MRLSALVASVGAGACGGGDRGADSTQAFPPTSGTGVPAVAQEQKPRTGPRISVDSTAREPRVESRGVDYVLHLPSDMARALYDSLPGFTPLQQSTYPADLAAKHNSPLSAVVGDFNGDSRRDVALIGDSGGTPAFVFLLAKSDSIAEPRIISILRPVPNTPTDLRSYYIQFVGPRRITYPGDPKTVLDLRTDAVHAINESVSTIYYLHQGEVRTFSVGGD